MIKNDDKRCRNQFTQVFRRERGICQICWSTTAEGDFELTGGMTGATGLFWTQFFMILGQIHFGGNLKKFQIFSFGPPG